MADSVSDSDINSGTKVDLVKLLSVFNWIRDHGEKQSGGEYVLGGLYASHDFDGYTLTLWDAGTRLDLFFHNRYKLDYQNRDQLLTFMRKVDVIFEQSCDK
ncbi:MAG: DUF3081 domain-containing protein [Amphritea sp.]|nr:DUF3081 domain-containing protein [Amphritea sp.]